MVYIELLLRYFDSLGYLAHVTQMGVTPFNYVAHQETRNT